MVDFTNLNDNKLLYYYIITSIIMQESGPWGPGLGTKGP